MRLITASMSQSCWENPMEEMWKHSITTKSNCDGNYMHLSMGYNCTKALSNTLTNAEENDETEQGLQSSWHCCNTTEGS